MSTSEKITIRAASLATVTAAPGELAKISIIAYTGGIMRISQGDVVIDLAGLELPEQISLLADHENALAAVAGHGRPTIVGNKLRIEGVIVRDVPAGVAVLRLYAGGVKLAASVGVQVITRKHIEPGGQIEVNGRSLSAPPAGLMLVTAGRLQEVSLLPVGADSSTSVNIAAKAAGGIGEMEPRTEQEIRAAERARLSVIDKTLTGLTGPRAEQLRAAAIAEQLPLEALHAGALELRRDERPQLGFSPAGALCEPREILAAATLQCMGYPAEKLISAEAAAAARMLGVVRLSDLCRAALKLEGREVPTGVGQVVTAGFSTMSLPVALSDSANKIVLESYAAAPVSWLGFGNVLSLSDFKAAPTIRPSFAGRMTQLAPDGEIKHGHIGEETGEIKLDTYAQLLRIDRQAMINDDGSVFAQTTAALGKNAARAVADLVYEVLLGNAGDFFSEAHANLLTGATSELAVDSLGEALMQITMQRDADGRNLDISPRVLLVPPELEFTGRQLLASQELARFVDSVMDERPMGNPLLNRLTLAVEPRLSNDTFTGASADAWYVFASPSDAAINVGFLTGQRAPTIESFGPSDQVEILAFSWRVHLDFGAALGDYRAAVRSDGK